MIWLVLRRHRVLLGVVALVIIGLGLWMYLLGRAYESALTSQACHYNTFRCPLNSGAWSISNQATALNFLVLFVPCLLGVIFGAPLVAGELERHTNRLAWTQGISRTKWLILKWLTVFLSLAIMVIALTIVAQWWSGRTYERVPGLVLGDVGGPVACYFWVSPGECSRSSSRQPALRRSCTPCSPWRWERLSELFSERCPGPSSERSLCTPRSLW